MSYLLSAELVATCNSLGYFDKKTKKYYADSNTLETVKDIIRYLRRDDESHEIRRYLGNSQVLQTDLLPLLKSYWEQSELFDVLLRLIVNLTSPALMLWQERMPVEKSARYYYLQIEDHQQKYKQAFADESIWAILSKKLSTILEIDFVERGEENNLIVERILILIRNVLYIPRNADEERRPDNDASVHDQVLWSLHQSGMLDIILFIVGSTAEQPYYMHVLELLSFMLREQSATALANTGIERSQTEKMRDEAELLLMRHHEKNSKQQKIKKFAGARHSRFGGTYVIQSLQAISDKQYVYHKPLNNVDSVSFDAEKKKTRMRKNLRPVQEFSSERRSAFSVKLILKEFCAEFLNAAYNTFMYYVRDNFARAKSQTHDESYYLWAMRFFMEFNRGNKFQVKLVSETISVQSFHFVQQQIDQYYDCVCLNKKESKPWARRLHIALLAYRELLLTVLSMDKSKDEGVRKSAKVIKSTIFYVLEYRELIIALMLSYDEVLFSHTYLNDLIETQHVFMKMLELYCKEESGIVVQGKKKKKSRKRKQIDVPDPDDTEPNLHEIWNEAAPQLSVLLGDSANIPTVVPFDATSEVPIDEQKTEAMKNIRKYLRESEFENALGLLRASREVWPENDSFGGITMAPEEELLIMQDIFFADFRETQKKTTVPSHTIEEDCVDDEEMEGISEEPSESNFKFVDFLKRFANQKVVKACCIALKHFEHNSVHTNYCILKLLHRIVFDLKMSSMIFQVSVFITFHKIYALKDRPQYADLVKFATYVLRQFFKLVPQNPKVFMEALFWKSSTDAFDIEEGYGSYQEKSKAEARHWSEAEENELEQLCNEHREKEIQEDIVDWIVSNLVDHTKTRRGVIKKLKSMSLLGNYKKNFKSSNVWSEEEEEKLRHLYDIYKDEDNTLELIANGLLTQRTKTKIVGKLLSMGIIENKNEVVKKRLRSKVSNLDDADSDSENSQSSDDDRSNNTRTTTKTVANVGKKTAARSKRAQVKVSRTDLIKFVLKVSHMRDALDWLRESLSDIIDDRKESGDDMEDEIPLVTIMDYSVAAMEDSNFQNLLKSMQIREPEDEQETHWRIPNHLSISTLEEYCQLLTDALENKLSHPEELSAPAADENSDSGDEDVFDTLRNIIRPSTDENSVRPNTSSEKSDGSKSDQEDIVESDSLNERSQVKSKRNPIFDSDEEENKENIPEKEVVINKRKFIDSDSDDDTDDNSSHISVKDDNKRERDVSDSDSPLKKKKRTRIILSDDDSSEG